MTETLWPIPTQAFLHNAARCLALASQGSLRLEANGQLAPSSQKLVRRHVNGEPPALPGSYPDHAYHDFVVGLLGQAGMLGTVDNSLRLSAEANAWLGLPAQQQLMQLRQTWLLALDLAWRWLPAGAEYRPRDGQWRGLVLGVMAEIAALPLGGWVPFSDLAGALEERGTLSAGGTGRNLPHVRRSVSSRAQQLLAFVAGQVLPDLGLVEINVQPNPLLRPTAEGVAWLRAALARLRSLVELPSDIAAEMALPAPGLRFPPAQEPALDVRFDEAEADGPALLLTLSSAAPALCTFELAHVAALISPTPPARYCLTQQTFQRAVEWGYSAADVLFLLERFSEHHLPREALALIDAWREELSTITYQPGFRLHLRAPELLAALRRRDPFRQRTLPLATGQDAWAGAAQAYDLFRYLRRVGYTLQEETSAASAATALPPSPFSPLPLSQLLVALQTYQQLRRLVPGLAVLDLAGLERAITMALTPEDLAAAGQLVESHQVFLRHHLKRDKGADEPDADKPKSPAAGQATSPELPAPGNPGSSSADLEARLQAAIDAQSALELTYADTQAQVTHRRVRPLHLVTRWGRRYLLAFCELRQDERHFRLDRIVEVKG